MIQPCVKQKDRWGFSWRSGQVYTHTMVWMLKYCTYGLCSLYLVMPAWTFWSRLVTPDDLQHPTRVQTPPYSLYKGSTFVVNPFLMLLLCFLIPFIFPSIFPSPYERRWQKMIDDGQTVTLLFSQSCPSLFNQAYFLLHHCSFFS
jgi:hypothetical protein